MQSFILALVRTLGRYTSVLLVAITTLVFVVWVGLFDTKPVYALIALPVVLPMAMASLALLLGVAFAGLRGKDGTPLASREDAPELWRMWDELAPVKWGQRRLIRIDDRFNASIGERQRLFGLAWPEVTMTIGLPMLHALDEPMVRSVVAHEVGHDACRHTLGGRNVYEFDCVLHEVFTTFPPHSTITGSVLYGLLGWLGDWLAEEHLRLSRLAEQQADAIAAAAIGREAFGESLAVFAAHAERYESEFAKPIYENLERIMHVPPSPMEALLHKSQRPNKEAMRPFAEAAFAKPHDPKSTHPVLSESLAAVGFDRLPELIDIGPRAISTLATPEFVHVVVEYYREQWNGYVSRYLKLG